MSDNGQQEDNFRLPRNCVDRNRERMIVGKNSQTHGARIWGEYLKLLILLWLSHSVDAQQSSAYYWRAEGETRDPGWLFN